MFIAELTTYGQSIALSQVNIDGVALFSEYISNIGSADVSQAVLDIEACGSINKSTGSVRILDSSSSTYTVRTIVFYVNSGSSKLVVAGYSQESSFILKTASVLNMLLPFDFSAFTNGFLFSTVQSGYSNASNNIDGVLHIENPDTTADDSYSVYNKAQVDSLLSSSIPADITNSELIGGFVRYNVSGTGNLSIQNVYGLFPYSSGTTTTLPAGTYLMRVRLRSTTANYSVTVNFGTPYTVTSSNGVIDDLRLVTLSSAQGFSASITQVAANTYIRVVIYEPGNIVTSVGPAAVTNDYNDLDNVPNGTLIIQKNGSNVASFSASANSNVTANISVPTTVASLSDAGNYVTTNTAQTISGEKTFTASNVKIAEGTALSLEYNDNETPSKIYVSDRSAVHTSGDSVTISDTNITLGSNTNYTWVSDDNAHHKLNIGYTSEDIAYFGYSGLNMASGKSVYANSFVKSGGTSYQFLKADGSVDSNTYLTSSSMSNYVTTNTAQTITGDKTINEKDLLISDSQSTPVTDTIDAFVMKRGQEFIAGTQSSSTGSWTGKTNQSAIYDGMCINYYLPYSGSGYASLTLTLPNNTTTDAIPIYCYSSSGSVTRLNTHFPRGSVIQMTLLLNRYIGSTQYTAAWVVNAYYYYDGNTYDRLLSNSAVKAGTNGIKGYTLVLRTGADTWESIVTSNDTGTNKSANTSGFYLDTVYYYNSSASISGGSSTYTIYTDYSQAYANRYFNLSSALTNAAPVYLIFTYNSSDGKYYLDTTRWWTQSPTTESSTAGKYFLYIGRAYVSGSNSYVSLENNHPLFIVHNGALKPAYEYQLEEKTYTSTGNASYDQIIQANDYRETGPSGTWNPRHKGCPVSLSVDQYLDARDGSRISIYVPTEKWVGSIAFLVSENPNRYAAYPIYFRGQGSEHNANVPAGTILRLTFRSNAFYVDFYDLADFGVEHEPIVRVGKVPHYRSEDNYNGTLVAARRSDGKFDTLINVNESEVECSGDYFYIINETNINYAACSPVYASFKGTCFSAHPRVPFGFITNLEYIHDRGKSIDVSNLKFIYVENDAVVDSSSTLASYEVTHPKNGDRYFHVPNAPVYILYNSYRIIVPNTGMSNYILIAIGGLPDSRSVPYEVGKLIGFLPSSIEDAGLLRLVNTRFDSSVVGLSLSTEEVILKSSDSSKSYPMVFASELGNGATSKTLYTDTVNSLYYNPSTNTLSCTTFSGTLSGTATNATYVNVSTSSSNSSYPLVFTSSVSAGNKTLYTDTANSLYYNPSTNALSGLFLLPRGDATLSNSVWTVSSPSPNPTTSADPPAGAIVCVYFGSVNSASSPTLKFGSWNAKPIWRSANTVVGTTEDTSWPAQSFVMLIYSSAWRLINTRCYPTTTSYSGDILPASNNAYDIGSPTLTWNDIYGHVIHAWGSGASSGLRLCDGNYEGRAYSSITGYQSGDNGQMMFHHYDATHSKDYVVTSTGPNTASSSATATLNTVPQSSNTWTIGSDGYRLNTVYTHYSNCDTLVLPDDDTEDPDEVHVRASSYSEDDIADYSGQAVRFYYYPDSEGLELNFFCRDGNDCNIYSRTSNWNLGMASNPFGNAYLSNIHLLYPGCSPYITLTGGSNNETALVPSSDTCCYIGTSSRKFWYGYFSNLYATNAFTASSATITNLTVTNLTVTNVNGSTYTTGGGSSSSGSTEIRVLYCQIIASVAGTQTGGFVPVSISYDGTITNSSSSSPSNGSYICKLYAAEPVVQGATTSSTASNISLSYSKGASVSGSWKLRHPLSISFQGTHNDTYSSTNGSYTASYRTYYANVIIIASKA